MKFRYDINAFKFQLFFRSLYCIGLLLILVSFFVIYLTQTDNVVLSQDFIQGQKSSLITVLSIFIAYYIFYN